MTSILKEFDFAITYLDDILLLCILSMLAKGHDLFACSFLVPLGLCINLSKSELHLIHFFLGLLLNSGYVHISSDSCTFRNTGVGSLFQMKFVIVHQVMFLGDKANYCTHGNAHIETRVIC